MLINKLELFRIEGELVRIILVGEGSKIMGVVLFLKVSVLRWEVFLFFVLEYWVLNLEFCVCKYGYFIELCFRLKGLVLSFFGI